MKRLVSTAVLTVAALVPLAGCTGRPHANPPVTRPSPQQGVKLYHDANGQLVQAEFCDGRGNRVRVAFQNNRADAVVTTIPDDPTCTVTSPFPSPTR